MTCRLPVVLLPLALLVGCQEPERFRSRALGEVEMAPAFAAAQDVLADYYPIEEVDEPARRITSGPKRIGSDPAGLVSRAQARERAVLRLRQEGPVVWADVRVLVEHQQAPGIRRAAPLTARRDLPSPTPAQEDAPYTRQQQEAWRVVRHNEDAEARILEDLYNSLHPAVPSGMTTTRPGS